MDKTVNSEYMMKFENIVAEKTGFHLACIFAVVFLVFGNSLFFDFVWDDRPLLLELDVYKDFKLKDMLFSPANGLEYLPVRDISYGIDYLLWGSNPAGFHLSNIIFYFLNCLVIYFLTLEITSLLFSGSKSNSELPSKLTAFFTALLFAVHPLHTEVVCFITGRNTILSGLFFFTSCFYFLKFLRVKTSGGKRYYFISLICFILAMLSKAISIILPLLLMLFLLFKIKELRKNVLLLIPFFLVSIAIFLIFTKIASESNMTVSDHSMVFGAFNFASKLAVSLQIPFFYVIKMLVPVNLSVEYTPEFSRSFGNVHVILSLSVLILTISSGILLRKKYPELLFTFLWFLIALIPVMNFVLNHPVVADRYVYLSSFAFFYFVTARLFSAFGHMHLKWIVFFITVTVLAGSLMSVDRSRVWKNEKALWADTVKSSPESFKPYVNLGSLYFNEGDFGRAFGLFSKLKELDPSSVTLEYYRGLQLVNSGNHPGAIKLLSAALASNNESMEINYLLGQSYEITGSIDKAIQSYMNILKSNELDTAGKKDFAKQRLARLRISKSDELNILRKKVKDNPSDLNARVNLAIALDRIGMFDEAIENYKTLEKIGGDNWVLFYNMANIYKKTENYEASAVYYRKSIAMNKKNADAYNNLGLVMKKLKKHDLAIKAFKDAIDADKNFAYAPFNLAVMYFHLGDRENALKYFNYFREKFPHLKGRMSPYIRHIEMKPEK
jgi:tetratricopeptide (TPR) repeat protein